MLVAAQRHNFEGWPGMPVFLPTGHSTTYRSAQKHGTGNIRHRRTALSRDARAMVLALMRTDAETSTDGCNTFVSMSITQKLHMV